MTQYPVVLLLIAAGFAALEPAAQAGQLYLFSIDGSTGEVEQSEDALGWETNGSGYSFVRTYTVGTVHYAALINQHTGDVGIFQLHPDDIGSQASTYHFRHRVSGAAIINESGAPRLVLHNLDTGFLSTSNLLAGGQLTTTSVVYEPSFVDRHLFSAYSSGSSWYLFGYDRWGGSAVSRTLSGQGLSNLTWTRGWSAVDYLRIGGDTFRLLYKHSDEPGNQGGRLLIQRINAQGESLATIHENLNEAKSWTSVRFLQTRTGVGNLQRFVFFYDATTGAYRVNAFTGTQLGAVTASGMLSTNGVDLATYSIGFETYLLLLDEDGVPPLSASEVENMADSVRGMLDGAVPGYQFGVMQHGRFVLLQSNGFQNLANNTPMTFTSHLNLGSVSKMFTAMSILKLIDWGEIDLDAPVVQYLNYSGGPLNYDFETIPEPTEYVTVRDLLTHTSKLRGSSTAPSPLDPADCTQPMYSSRDPLTCVASDEWRPDWDCPRDYANHNFGLLRQIIESFTTTHDVPSLDAFTHHLWMDRIGMYATTCLDPPGDAALYVHRRESNCPNPPQFDGSFLEASNSCGAGGWKSNVLEVLRFMRAAVHRQAVGPELTELLLDWAMFDVAGNFTAISWDVSNSGEPFGTLGKAGGFEFSDAATSAQIYIFPGNIFAFLAFNTDKYTCDTETDTAGQALRAAWNAK